MCEHREIDLPERIIYNTSPMDSCRSYLRSVKNRAASWTRLTTNPVKIQFLDIVYRLKLNEHAKQRLWLLIAYCNYNLISPVTFFDFLMEVAIEERVTMKSYATPEALRKWPNHPIPEYLSDNVLIFLYLIIRDGASRTGELLHLVETL